MENKEIERRFLIDKDMFVKFLFENFINGNMSYQSKHIKQIYLSEKPAIRVRVSETIFGGRITDITSELTIKSAPNEKGECFEWNHPITADRSNEIISSCMNTGEYIGSIFKTRYLIPMEDPELKIELDIFYGQNDGLIIAEVELPSVDYEFKIPDWFGKDITGDYSYSNVNLSQQ